MSDYYYNDLRKYAAECMVQKWELLTWVKQPALVNKERTKSCQYTGQQYDPKKFDVDPQGWDHEHCRFCFVTISDCGHSNCCGEGYTNGDNEWICPDCFEHLITNGEDPELFLETKMDNS
jgi:hypothetical protein